MSKTKSELQRVLSSEPRQDLSEQIPKAASVALLLSGKLDNLEVFFIKRAVNPADHWSGHIAFPGGKKEDSDASLLATCHREVFEELGLRLSDSWLLGPLSDVQARRGGMRLPFFIRPFAFHLDSQPAALRLQATEVAGTLWVPLATLADPANKTHYALNREGVQLDLPAIRLPTGDILWGLTHFMVQDFLRRMRMVTSEPVGGG